MFTEEYQKFYLEANQEVFDKTKNFVGEPIWNFADFETSQGIIRAQEIRKGHSHVTGGRNLQRIT